MQTQSKALLGRVRLQSWGIALFLGSFVAASQANIFFVDTANELGSLCLNCCTQIGGTPDCSFRQAVIKANGNPGGDEIRFLSSISQVNLTISGPDDDNAAFGDIDILDDLYINGGGRIVFDASGLSDRVFEILGANVSFESLTIQGGNTQSAQNGGGIRVAGGQFTALYLTIRQNQAIYGGGIYASTNSNVELLTGTTVDDNQAVQSGGGLFCSAFSNCQLMRATVSNNSANTGGGIYISSLADADISLSTISGNSSASGAGIYIRGQAVIGRTTIANNPATMGGSVALASSSRPEFLSLEATLIDGDCTGATDSIISLGGNLESPGDTCSLTTGLDQYNVADAGLMPLGDYGGSTFTHDLVLGSPAIDDPLAAIPNCAPGGTDQRLLQRPKDGDGDHQDQCDIGAVEFQDGPTPPGDIFRDNFEF